MMPKRLGLDKAAGSTAAKAAKAAKAAGAGEEGGAGLEKPFREAVVIDATPNGGLVLMTLQSRKALAVPAEKAGVWTRGDLVAYRGKKDVGRKLKEALEVAQPSNDAVKAFNETMVHHKRLSGRLTKVPSLVEGVWEGSVVEERLEGRATVEGETRPVFLNSFASGEDWAAVRAGDVVHFSLAVSHGRWDPSQIRYAADVKKKVVDYVDIEAVEVKEESARAFHASHYSDHLGPSPPNNFGPSPPDLNNTLNLNTSGFIVPPPPMPYGPPPPFGFPGYPPHFLPPGPVPIPPFDAQANMAPAPMPAPPQDFPTGVKGEVSRSGSQGLEHRPHHTHQEPPSFQYQPPKQYQPQLHQPQPRQPQHQEPAQPQAQPPLPRLHNQAGDVEGAGGQGRGQRQGTGPGTGAGQGLVYPAFPPVTILADEVRVGEAFGTLVRGTWATVGAERAGAAAVLTASVQLEGTGSPVRHLSLALSKLAEVSYRAQSGPTFCFVFKPRGGELVAFRIEPESKRLAIQLRGALRSYVERLPFDAANPRPTLKALNDPDARYLFNL